MEGLLRVAFEVDGGKAVGYSLLNTGVETLLDKGFWF
jgi:hypothetical protein